MKKSIIAIFAIALTSWACQNQNTEASMEKSDTDTSATEASASMKDELPSVPDGARVYFANLEDGDTVSSPVYVEFGIEGMEVEPAGEVHAGKGHHHVIINGNYLERGGTVPADSVNIHYGGGQVSDSLDLPMGTHKLTMQFADGYHRSYGKPLSTSINITVQ